MVIPNGDGTSTVIMPDGTIRTIPSASAKPSHGKATPGQTSPDQANAPADVPTVDTVKPAQ